MTQKNLRKLSLAASAFVFAGLFSFGWSDRSGLSLSIEKAEARVGRPLTPMSVAGVARRQNRRAVVGTAAAVGAASYYAGSGYHDDADASHHYGSVRAARAAYYGGASADSIPAGGLPHYAVHAYHADGPWYGYSGWDDYAARNGIKCAPGTLVKLDDAQMYICQ